MPVFKKLNSRKFVFVSMFVLILFGTFHLWTWETYTKDLLAPEASIHAGDLARIGYHYNSLQLRKTEVTLPHKHIQSAQWDGENADVVTFGDSFSIGAAGGKNPYYQDFIASENNLTVLNIERDTHVKDEEFLNDLIGIINSGFLEDIKAKILVVESVERMALLRMAHDLDWDKTTSIAEVKQGLKSNAKSKEAEKISIINPGNYKFFLYNFYYQFSPDAFGKSAAHRYPLNKKFFNSKQPDTLLFYNQDITSLGMITSENIQKMNENLNHLAGLLDKKNIKLIFMLPVDKYDLYYPYIINNKYEKNNFFDLFRLYDKHYTFIDTKKILTPLLANNVRDVYYGDDTHWSYKASEAVVRSIPFKQLLEQPRSK